MLLYRETEGGVVNSPKLPPIHLLAILLVLGGCAASPRPPGTLPPVQEPTPDATPPGVEIRPLARPGAISPDSAAPTSTPSNAAVIALLDEAGQQVQGGELNRAAATLERAVRLDSRNPEVWHDLGEVRYRQGQYTQAEELAARARHLAANNRELQARTWRLTAKARRARRDYGGADAADAQALLLERR